MGVIPERGGLDGASVGFPVELLELGAQMDWRPSGDDPFIINA